MNYALARTGSSTALGGFLKRLTASRRVEHEQSLSVLVGDSRPAVGHDILDFSARVFATVVGPPLVTPHPGGFKRRH